MTANAGKDDVLLRFENYSFAILIVVYLYVKKYLVSQQNRLITIIKGPSESDRWIRTSYYPNDEKKLDLLNNWFTKQIVCITNVLSCKPYYIFKNKNQVCIMLYQIWLQFVWKTISYITFSGTIRFLNIISNILNAIDTSGVLVSLFNEKKVRNISIKKYTAEKTGDFTYNLTCLVVSLFVFNLIFIWNRIDNVFFVRSFVGPMSSVNPDGTL